jgi:4-amino-4-deoxy-L-arabinose transferase-like glycosyltransferase
VIEGRHRWAAVLAPGLVGLALLIGFAVHLVSIDAPFAHDEAVYAIGGKSLVTGVGADQYSIYRPVGMRLLAAPGALLGDGEAGFRAFSIAWSVACLVAFWLAGRRMVGGAAGWTVLALVTSLQLQRRSAELLSDLPSLTFIFALIWLLAGEVERAGGPRRRFLWIAPLAAAAFYVRYGSLLVLVAVAAAAIAVWWRPLIASRGRILAAAGLFAALMVPHFAHSLAATGSLSGILAAGHQAANRSYFGEGLAFYARTFPDRPGGYVVAALLIVGLVWGALHLARARRGDHIDRAVAFAFLAALLHTLLIGIDVHGEPRFIFFGMMLLALLGVHAVGAAVAHQPRVRVGAVAAALLLAAASLMTHRRIAGQVVARDRGRQATLETAQLLRARGEGSCAVMSTEAPLLTWYGGCDGYPMTGDPERVIRRMRRGGYAALFVVVFEDGPRDPRGAQLARLLASVEQPPIAVIGDPSSARGIARVYQVKPARPL